VLVTGGAFVEPGPDPDDEAPLRRTYRPTPDLYEAFPLELVLEALSAARVFSRAEPDAAAPPRRARIAGHDQALLASSAELRELLAQARDAGHDFLLVLERVEDGRVEYRGINGQWPITLAAWLLIGLGALIPDHTYESHASLQATLRDVESGGSVMQLRSSGGVLDLPLLQRSDFLGFLTSLIVPPFWVGDDDEKVEAIVREIVTGQLAASMARQLKSTATRTSLQGLLAATPALVAEARGWRIAVQAQESLSLVRLRADDAPVVGPEFDAFERELLASGRPHEGGLGLRYEALYARPPAARRVQVLLQTVSGRVASSTIVLSP
jgi:hypothetical protein